MSRHEGQVGQLRWNIRDNGVSVFAVQEKPAEAGLK